MAEGVVDPSFTVISGTRCTTRHVAGGGRFEGQAETTDRPCGAGGTVSPSPRPPWISLRSESVLDGRGTGHRLARQRNPARGGHHPAASAADAPTRDRSRPRGVADTGTGQMARH